MHASEDSSRLAVCEGGPGIPVEAQQRVFERFVQLAPKSRAGGFGLVLWIVYSIKYTHGGSITLTNKPGEGTPSRFCSHPGKARKATAPAESRAPTPPLAAPLPS